MKKYYILFLIFVIMFISSCSNLKKDNNKTDVELNHYEFLNKEETNSLLNTYDIVIQNGTDLYEFMENENGLYFSYNNTSYLFSKIDNLCYSLDNANREKQEKKLNATLDTVKNTLLEYLNSHYEIKDSLFVLDEKTKEVIGFNCNVYYLESFDNGSKESYYVNESGLCLKRILTSASKTIFWEVVKYSTNEAIINIDMEDYFNFETTIPYTYYTSWPTSYLASLIPEFKAGNFVAASDNEEICTIYYNSISLTNFNEYVEKVKLAGFSGEETVFDGNQIYKCNLSNSSNIYVELAYDLGQYQIRIEISKSSY